MVKFNFSFNNEPPMGPIAEFFAEILIEGIFRNTWNILKAIYRQGPAYKKIRLTDCMIWLEGYSLKVFCFGITETNTYFAYHVKCFIRIIYIPTDQI